MIQKFDYIRRRQIDKQNKYQSLSVIEKIELDLLNEMKNGK